MLLNNKKNINASIPPLFTMAVFFLSAILFYVHDSLSDDEFHGDAYVSGNLSDARTLVPILASDTASSGITAMVFNGLIKYDRDLNLVGDLARSWEVRDDGLTIIFHIRKDVKWHDGQPFTARDVEFTYQKLVDPSVPTPYSGDFKKVRSLKAVDEHTIRIEYKEPFSPGLASWTMPVMPEHILRGEDLVTTKFARNPIGTGPYKFLKWESGSRIDLVANREYFEHYPYIERYIYRIIPDPATMFLELNTGAVDSMGLSPLQYSRLTGTKKFKDNYDKYKFPSFGYTYMGYNLRNTLFSDKNIRKAINLAVNKKEIIDGVLLGFGRECTGPFLPDTWAYNPNVKPAEFDQEAAKELLRSSGWVDTDEDGWLDKKGERFEFTIITNKGNDLRLQTAQIIQRRLKDIGVKVNIRVLEWTVFINEFVDKKRFDAVLLGWSLSRDPDCYDIWHSSKTKEGEFNFISYKNAEVDKLLEEGRRVFDQEKRKVIYNKIHRLIYDDQPCLFLYIPDSLIAINKRFKGVSPSIIGIRYNFIDWHVRRDDRKYLY